MNLRKDHYRSSEAARHPRRSRFSGRQSPGHSLGPDSRPGASRPEAKRREPGAQAAEGGRRGGRAPPSSPPPPSASLPLPPRSSLLQSGAPSPPDRPPRRCGASRRPSPRAAEGLDVGRVAHGGGGGRMSGEPHGPGPTAPPRNLTTPSAARRPRPGRRPRARGHPTLLSPSEGGGGFNVSPSPKGAGERSRVTVSLIGTRKLLVTFGRNDSKRKQKP